MRRILKGLSAEFYLALFAFVCGFIFFKQVTDDYASFGSNCAAGQFSNYPYCEYYWGLFGVSWVYKRLYLALPAYDWLSMSFILYEFLSLYLLLKSIKDVVVANPQHRAFLWYVQVLFALFYTENIIYLSHTRSSLPFCGVALVNLLFTAQISPKRIAANTAIFVFGMLIRPESSMGMLLLVCAGYCIYRFNLLHIIRRVFFPALATAIMLVCYYVDWSHTNLFIKKVEPEVEYKLMEKRVAPVSIMHTALDSVKYEAAVAGFCFDTRVVTPEFFRKILLPGADLSFEHIKLRFWHVILLYQYYPFIPFYMFGLLLLCIVMARSRVLVFKTLLFQAVTFLIIYAVDYTGGLIAGRHFLNLELISLLITTLYFFSTEQALFTRWKQRWQWGVACFALVLCGVYISIGNFKNDSEGIASAIECYEANMTQLDSLYSGRIIILTSDDFHVFDHVFSIRNKKYSRNKYLMYDVWTYYLYPEYLDYLKTECHCDPLDPVAFYHWLAANHALYLADGWRCDLTAKYMDMVHHSHIKFEQPQQGFQKPACMQSTNLPHFEYRVVAETP